jgi:hypothetical protein
VRLAGAAVAIAIGFAGTRWGAQGAVAAIAVIAIEQRLELRKS